MFSAIINTTGHTQLLRAFKKYSHIFKTSFFGRKIINVCTHTPVAECSVDSHSSNSHILKFYLNMKKEITHLDSEHQIDKTGALSVA